MGPAINDPKNQREIVHVFRGYLIKEVRSVLRGGVQEQEEEIASKEEKMRNDP